MLCVPVLLQLPAQAATSGDLLRASFANATQTPIDRIYVYQTRTVNSAAGQPSTEVSGRGNMRSSGDGDGG